MADSLLENYNPLYDVHLRQYFALPHMQKHLRRMGLLDSNGVPVAQNGNVESELYARHHAMMDMMLRNRERVLMQLAELQKKYDAAEKVEIYRRVRSGVTDAEEFRRNHLSRSLSRPRRSATQPAKTSGRRRHSSNSFEDTEVIKRIETAYEQPQTAPTNIKNTYDRLSANTFKYQFLHKLDDTTLMNYKDSLQKQLQKLKRFRDISFGPHNVARHQTSQPASWFFRRRSLPSLSNSAPQNSLHSPIRSLKAAKDVHSSANGTSHGEERRTRQGKSQSPRRYAQAADRPRPRRAASPTKRAATTHAGTRLPPINKEAAPIKPPRIQQRAAPTPEAREEDTGLLGKIAGGAIAAATAVGGAVAAAIGVSDNEEEHPKEEEQMDTTDDQDEERVAGTPSQSPEALPSPVGIAQNEEVSPSPIPSPQHEEAVAKTPSPVPIHVREASPLPSDEEDEYPPREPSLPPSPRHEEDWQKSSSPIEDDEPKESSPAPSHPHEDEHPSSPIESHREERYEEHEHSSSPFDSHKEDHEKLLDRPASPTESQKNDDFGAHDHSSSPVESHKGGHKGEHHNLSTPGETFREHRDDHDNENHRYPGSPDLTNAEYESNPNHHTPSRFDSVHTEKAHSFHEDYLRETTKDKAPSHDIEIEDTQQARDKRGVIFETDSIRALEEAEEQREYHEVMDQKNGMGEELQEAKKDVDKLFENKNDDGSARSHHSEEHSEYHENDIEDDGHHKKDVEEVHPHRQEEQHGNEDSNEQHVEHHSYQEEDHTNDDSGDYHKEEHEKVHHINDSDSLSPTKNEDENGDEDNLSAKNGSGREGGGDAKDNNGNNDPSDSFARDDEHGDGGEHNHQTRQMENDSPVSSPEHQRKSTLPQIGLHPKGDFVAALDLATTPETAEKAHELQGDDASDLENCADYNLEGQEEEDEESEGAHTDEFDEQNGNNNESSHDNHESQSNEEESHGDAQLKSNEQETHDDARFEHSADIHGNVMEQSIYQSNHDEDAGDNSSIQSHDVHQSEEPEHLAPSSPSPQDIMVNSFYPGTEPEEVSQPASPVSQRSVEAQSHREHIERDPIQAQEHAFVPGFIPQSAQARDDFDEHEQYHNEEQQKYNGVYEEEHLDPPATNRSLDSFQQHEQDVADDIQHENDANSENRDPYASHNQRSLLNQPSIEITAASDFGGSQDDVDIPDSPNAASNHGQTHNSYVISHPEQDREHDISDEDANESSSLLANGHEGDQEDQEDDDEDSGSVIMHKTPDSAIYQQQHHQQHYQQSDDEQSETGQGHL